MKVYLDFFRKDSLSLFTDFYELAMCASYFDNNKFESATFDLFIRNMPQNRSYFLFTGLEQVLLFLKSIKFTNDQIIYLKNQGFNTDFLNYLATLRNRRSVLCAYNGNNFDFKYLDEKIRSNRLPTLAFKKVEKIDLLEICRKNLYVPKGYSLSSVASYFGYRFKHPEKNGYHMGLEYQGFILGTLEEPDWEKIIEYNKDDVLAMKYIIESIRL